MWGGFRGDDLDSERPGEHQRERRREARCPPGQALSTEERSYAAGVKTTNTHTASSATGVSPSVP